MGRTPSPRQPSGRPELLRLHNRTLILSLLRQRPLSRAELSRQLGLAMPTVSRLVEQMLRDGLIEEGHKQATGGRHSTALQLRADAGFVLGAELGRDRIRVVLSDLRGTVRARALQPKGADANQDIALLADMATALLKEVDVEPKRLMGIGVGVPGPLDLAEGVVVDPPNFKGWSFVPLRRLLEDRFGVPVWIENDANAGAFGEFLLNHSQVRNLVYVIADAGIGAGLILEQQLYRGEGGAGELGHCPVQLSGPLCPCGRRGCVEAIASTDAMLVEYRRRARLRARRAPAAASTASPVVGPAALAAGEKAHARSPSEAPILPQPRENRRDGGGGPADDGGRLIDPGKDARFEDHEQWTFETLLTLETRRDPEARAVLARGGKALGAGLAILANLLNPEVIVLGGRASQSPAYLRAAERELRRRRFGTGEVRVVVTQLGRESIALGASLLALQSLFESPFAIGHGVQAERTREAGRH